MAQHFKVKTEKPILRSARFPSCCFPGANSLRSDDETQSVESARCFVYRRRRLRQCYVRTKQRGNTERCDGTILFTRKMEAVYRSRRKCEKLCSSFPSRPFLFFYHCFSYFLPAPFFFVLHSLTMGNLLLPLV